jgi:prepilin-type N-terminal cleavage/methylation domain-containing protein
MRRLGFTLVELLVSLVIFAIILAAIFTAFVAMWKSQGVSIGLPASQQGAEAIVYKLGNAFRAATNCLATDTGCVVGTPVQNATSTGCTIYTRNSSGTLVQTTYGMSGTNFQMTSGGTTTVLSANANVTLTYYTSSTYNSTALTAYTPTSSTAANLIGVLINVNVSQGGGNNWDETFVRLRNGP